MHNTRKLYPNYTPLNRSVMKQIVLITLFIASSLIGSSQTDSKYSIEFTPGYIYYAMDNVYENNFNYDFSLLAARKLSNVIKLKIGIGYSVKNFFYETEPTNFNDYFYKKEYKIKYLNIPILLSYSNPNQGKVSFELTSGIIINLPFDYDVIRFYKNNPDDINSNIKNRLKTGFSYRFGVGVSMKLSSSISIALSPYFDYKFILDTKDQRPHYLTLPEDRLKVGVELTICYNF